MSGGNKERKKLGTKGGSGFYSILKKNNYPEGYQVLCYNCNLAKGHVGYCPHIDHSMDWEWEL